MLAARMCDAGLLDFEPPWSAATLRGIPLAAELFGLPMRGVDALRAILDRRPRNAAGGA